VLSEYGRSARSAPVTHAGRGGAADAGVWAKPAREASKNKNRVLFIS
jgi:hypothetical protein